MLFFEKLKNNSIRALVLCFLFNTPTVEAKAITQDYDLARYECKCGCGKKEVVPRLVSKINYIEREIGLKLRINSAYRCESHNRSVGGVLNSSHTLGLAVDVRVRSTRERNKVIYAARLAGFTRIGIAKRFVHLDIDDSKPDAVWWY